MSNTNFYPRIRFPPLPPLSVEDENPVLEEVGQSDSKDISVKISTLPNELIQEIYEYIKYDVWFWEFKQDLNSPISQRLNIYTPFNI